MPSSLATGSRINAMLSNTLFHHRLVTRSLIGCCSPEGCMLRGQLVELSGDSTGSCRLECARMVKSSVPFASGVESKQASTIYLSIAGQPRRLLRPRGPKRSRLKFLESQKAEHERQKGINSKSVMMLNATASLWQAGCEDNRPTTVGPGMPPFWIKRVHKSHSLNVFFGGGAAFCNFCGAISTTGLAGNLFKALQEGDW